MRHSVASPISTVFFFHLSRIRSFIFPAFVAPLLHFFRWPWLTSPYVFFRKGLCSPGFPSFPFPGVSLLSPLGGAPAGIGFVFFSFLIFLIHSRSPPVFAIPPYHIVPETGLHLPGRPPLRILKPPVGRQGGFPFASVDILVFVGIRNRPPGLFLRSLPTPPK